MTERAELLKAVALHCASKNEGYVRDNPDDGLGDVFQMLSEADVVCGVFYVGDDPTIMPLKNPALFHALWQGAPLGDAVMNALFVLDMQQANDIADVLAASAPTFH
jgi:hypothetical protein